MYRLFNTAATESRRQFPRARSGSFPVFAQGGALTQGMRRGRGYFFSPISRLFFWISNWHSPSVQSSRAPRLNAKEHAQTQHGFNHGDTRKDRGDAGMLTAGDNRTFVTARDGTGTLLACVMVHTTTGTQCTRLSDHDHPGICEPAELMTGALSQCPSVNSTAALATTIACIQDVFTQATHE